MKKFMVLLLLIGSFSSVFAEMNYSMSPVAGTDGFLAAKVNPAALAFENAAGLGFLSFYDSDYEFDLENYSLFFNGNGLVYLFEHGEDDFHTLALSNTIFRNFYLGVSFDWQNKHFKKGNFSESFLYRPYDFVSLGGIGKDIFKKEAEYRVGCAVRPLFIKGKISDRITLSSDFIYSNKDWIKPVLGIQTELLDGINLGGSYHLEDETLSFDISFAFDKLKIGNITNFDEDSKVAGGSYYVNISDKSFRSFIGKEENKFYDFKLKGKIIEKKPGFDFGPFTFISSKNKTISELIEKIEELKEDNSIQGIVFTSPNFKASFAQVTELKSALLDFKSSGKKVVFYCENISNMNYIFAASVADEIYMHPSGWIGLRGISVSVPYIKDLLDTLGIEVVNFRSHDYKNAGNIFSETAMTEEERESYEYLLEGFFEDIVDMIESGRKGKIKKSVETIIDEGPYLIAQQALENGLVDDLLNEDELEDKLRDLVEDARIVKRASQDMVRYDWSDEQKDKIALIYAVGYIHMGKGQTGKTIGSITTAKAIKQAREDKSIKGIILRIDSGGGSSLASDIIGREIELCKTGENKKPVIASMSGVAASGGYHIAALSDEIIAQPNTLTGSIGVMGLAFNLEELYKKIHINWSIVKEGENSDIGSTSRKMTDQEKEKIEEAIEDSYDKFISFVAEGRNMEKSEVHKVAQGRVWTGRQALERGLIDKLGGMELAISDMKEIANLKHEVELIEFDGKRKTNILLGFNIKSKSLTDLNIPGELYRLIDYMEKFQLYGDEKILKVIPYDLEIK